MPEKISISYGSDKIEMEIPEKFVSTQITGPRLPPKEKDLDIRDMIRDVLKEPVNSPRPRDLVKDKDVVVVYPDEFREGHLQEMMQCMAEELKDSGYRSLLIMVSTGSHDPQFFTKKIRQYFKEFFTPLGNVDFHANSIDDDDFCLLGMTEYRTTVKINKKFLNTDVRIFCHEGKFHYMNGYSVIDKQVLPGVCARETIGANHKLSLSASSCAGRNPYSDDPRLRNNPFSNDIHEAFLTSCKYRFKEGELIQDPSIKTFGLDMVSTTDQIVWVNAGEIDVVEREMVKMVDSLARFDVAPQKYVLISPGGPPQSTSIYGVQNSMDMALRGAIEDGGEALIIAPCEGSEGMPEDIKGLAPSADMKVLFWENLVKLKNFTYEQSRDYIDNNFKLGLWKTNRVLHYLNARKLKLHLYSDLAPEKVRDGGFIPVDDPEKWIEERAQRKDGKLIIIDQGNRLLVMPKE